jgi:prevent-host-death family protein
MPLKALRQKCCGAFCYLGIIAKPKKMSRTNREQTLRFLEKSDMPTISKARANLSDILAEAYYNGKRTDVTRRNTPYAAIVPIADIKSLKRVDEFMQKHGFANKKELIAWLEQVIR